MFEISGALTTEVLPGTYGFSNPYTIEGLGLAITVISFFYVIFILTANVDDDTRETVTLPSRTD